MSMNNLGIVKRNITRADRAAVEKLSVEDMLDVAAYAASLQP